MTFTALARRRFCLMLASAVILLVEAKPALAQAPMPIGNWYSKTSPSVLVVEQTANCGFFYKGKVQVSGRCTWNASSNGGILDITYPMPLEPGHVRYNIVWIDKDKIRVWGEVFYRK